MRYVCVCANLFRSAEPATTIGLALLIVTVCLLASNIVSPPPYAVNGGMDLLQRPLSTTVYLVILVGYACWFQIRFRACLPRCGFAAAKITLLAGAPTVAAALLILSGILRVVALGPGEAPTTFHEHGLTLTWYTAQHQVPASGLLLLWVLLRLPESYFLGILGGFLGRAWGEAMGRPPEQFRLGLLEH